MHDTPTIRIQVEGLRHSVLHAFDQHSGELSHLIEKELAEQVTAERIAAEVNRCVHEILARSVENSISSALNFGDTGRQFREAVAQQVQRELDRLLPALDRED